MDKKEILYKKALFQKAGYTPHHGQETIHFTDWTFNVSVWGRRGGKTMGAAMEALYYLSQPNKRIWVVAPNYTLTEKVFREVYRLVVLEGVLGDPSKILTSKRMDTRGGMRIETTWGSWIEGKSTDNPNSLVGEGLDFLIIDEAAKVNQGVYEQYLEPTLLDRRGKCLMITTPEGHNWLYQLWLRGDNQEEYPGWVNSRFASQDNPYLDREWIEQKKFELGDNEVFRQEYMGSFEHHTGLIWPEFRDYKYPNGHLFNDDLLKEITGSSDIPVGWTVYRSIDIGLANPTACIWAAVDFEGNIWIFDEYRVRDTLADVHAENINAKTRHKVTTTYISHDADNRSKTDGKTVKEIFRDKGVYTYPVRPDRYASVQAVARYLRATLENNPADPRLFIHERCSGLRGEILQYVYDTPSRTSEKDAPDKPRAYKCDLVDALRNLIQMEPKHRRAYTDIIFEDMPQHRKVDGRPHAGV